VALDAFTAEAFDLILMDVQVPDMCYRRVDDRDARHARANLAVDRTPGIR
jgi:hypothetical protein